MRANDAGFGWPGWVSLAEVLATSDDAEPGRAIERRGQTAVRRTNGVTCRQLAARIRVRETGGRLLVMRNG
jgi:hypothetical protein